MRGNIISQADWYIYWLTITGRPRDLDHRIKIYRPEFKQWMKDHNLRFSPSFFECFATLRSWYNLRSKRNRKDYLELYRVNSTYITLSSHILTRIEEELAK